VEAEQGYGHRVTANRPLRRVYLGAAIVSRLDAGTAHLVGQLGRMVPKVDVYAAIIEVGLLHADEG